METKDIALAIREKIFKEIELRDKHAERRKRYWDRAFEVGKEHNELARHFLACAMDAETQVNFHNDNLRRFRYALHQLLEVLEIPFDTFRPEVAEIEL